MTRGVTPLFPSFSTNIYLNLIHTSARGVTNSSSTVSPSLSIFQSTLPQEEWPKTRQKQYWDLIFQSTLPQGEWRKPKVINQEFDDFNPHSHKGSDGNIAGKKARKKISIHTPTRGVTGIMYLLAGKSWFQSTLPQGEWHHTMMQFFFCNDFNPHSHKGSDCVP